MTDIRRLGLGCMGMNMSNADRSVETVRYALELDLTGEELCGMEQAFPAELMQGMGMRNTVFRDGKFAGGR